MMPSAQDVRDAVTGATRWVRRYGPPAAKYGAIGVVGLSLAIVGFGILMWPAAEVQHGLNEQMVESCNEDYGPGGWVAVPANGSERGLQMGQMAVCVSEDSPRAADCDSAWIFGCDPPETYPPGGGD